LQPRDGTAAKGPSAVPAAKPQKAANASTVSSRSADPALAELPLRPWTRTDALVVLICMLGTLAALNLALSTHVVMLMPASGRVYARAGGLAIAYAFEVGVIWLLARRHGVGLGKALGLSPVVRSGGRAAVSILLVLAALVCTRLVSTGYSVLTETLHWQPTFGWNTDLTQIFGHGRAGLTLTILLVVLVGPFVEEITFRGVAQSALRRRWSAWASIVGTSAVFAIYHFDPWMFLPTFVLALALGWLAENRRGLWPSIALHVLYNGVTVTAVFWLAAQGV
jgi:membrane protease YdiL (CAAX protease family)